MGYLSSRQWSTKQDMVDHICSNFKLVDHSVRGGVLYGVYPFDNGDGFGIVICLIEKFGEGEYGYKDMGEGDYPYYFDCPERILAKSTLPDTSGWRAECRSRRISKFKPRDGITVEWQAETLPDWCCGERLFWVKHYPPNFSRRGVFVYQAVNRQTICYRLTGRMIASLKPKVVTL